MRSLTPARTVTTAASIALASLIAAAPQAGAIIGEPAPNAPRVIDNGASLSVPVNATTDATADTAVARKVAGALVGDWAGSLIDDAVRNTPPTAATCEVTATATDPNGAAGTASATLPADTSISSLTIPDQVRGTAWGVGHVDHFTVKLTCTDAHQNTHVSETSIEQDAVAS